MSRATTWWKWLPTPNRNPAKGIAGTNKLKRHRQIRPPNRNQDQEDEEEIKIIRQQPECHFLQKEEIPLEVVAENRNYKGNQPSTSRKSLTPLKSKYPNA